MLATPILLHLPQRRVSQGDSRTQGTRTHLWPTPGHSESLQGSRVGTGPTSSCWLFSGLNGKSSGLSLEFQAGHLGAGTWEWSCSQRRKPAKVLEPAVPEAGVVSNFRNQLFLPWVPVTCSPVILLGATICKTQIRVPFVLLGINSARF